MNEKIDYDKINYDDIDPKHKQWIDNASYREMLTKNRFAPIGDPMFKNKTVFYFLKVMKEKRARLPEGCSAKISKQIGWRDW